MIAYKAKIESNGINHPGIGQGTWPSSRINVARITVVALHRIRH